MENETQQDAPPKPNPGIEQPQTSAANVHQPFHSGNKMDQIVNDRLTTSQHPEEANGAAELPFLKGATSNTDESLLFTTAAPVSNIAATTLILAQPIHNEVHWISNVGTNTIATTKTIAPVQVTHKTGRVTLVNPLGRGDNTAQSEATGSGITRKHPESPLIPPLTHRNGARMFPSFTASQEEGLAGDAPDQAQGSISADASANLAIADEMSDRGYESAGFSSASTSAESSVRDYMYENGRRYHAFREGQYNFPNDDIEQECEDMKHAMVKLLWSQKLHFAPIGDNPQQILDIGTGIGIWALEMGDLFPSAHVLGVDLSPIQPDWLPPNVKFLIDDVESRWLHPRNHFDYIHSRHTVMAIKDWMRLFRRSLKHLKPGGWIELQEIHHKPRSAIPGGTVPPDHPAARFWDLVTEGLSKLGINMDVIAEGNLCKMMEDAGFINVIEQVLHVPIGIWPKDKILKTVGLYWRTILLDGLQAIALGPLTRGLQWRREEVEVFLASVRQAHQDNSALMYMPLHIVCAQKPLDMA